MASRLFIQKVNVLLLVTLALAACAQPRVITESLPPGSATVAPQSPESTIYAHLQTGHNYLQAGDSAAALKEFRKAYQSLTPDTTGTLKGHILNLLGEALIASNNFKEAIPVCHSALLINLSCNNRIETAISHLHLGDAINKNGDSSVAMKHWEMAYEIAHKMGHTALIKAAQTRESDPSLTSVSYAKAASR